MKSSLDFCPVPEEQQPVNEYEQLKESWFFRWATLDVASYTKKIVWLWLWTWLIVGPIAAASFPLKKAPFLFFCAGIFGSTILVGLVLLRLYLGWIYVYDRLQSEKVFYEESGWYDGQINRLLSNPAHSPAFTKNRPDSRGNCRYQWSFLAIFHSLTATNHQSE